jgi:hypothetical protein
MDVSIKLYASPKWADELKKRMRRVGLSQAQLGREMDPPRDATQVTRWFTKNEARRVQPELTTAIEMERVVEKYERRAAKKASNGSAAMNE